MFVFLSVLSVSQSACLSIRLSVYRFICLSNYLSIYLFVCLSSIRGAGLAVVGTITHSGYGKCGV